MQRTMLRRIIRLGKSSRAITLPTAFAEKLGLSFDELVEIEAVADGFFVRRRSRPPPTLQDLLSESTPEGLSSAPLMMRRPA
jgi:antitoxin component of MazEF toxin-antitoxin module